MCSIIGLAGDIQSLSRRRKRELHEFMSVLFSMGEVRGRDAAGFFVWRGDHYVWERRPGPASDLIERNPRWQSLANKPGSLYICHTRSATDGDPDKGMNNHPFVGDRFAMVHNGMIYGHNDVCRIVGRTIKSDCDSEVILAALEAYGSKKDQLHTIIENTMDAVDSAASTLATAVIDKSSPDRVLLFRNTGNPLWVFNSERFNCTFFATTDDIFESAVKYVYGSEARIEDIAETFEEIDAYHLYHLMDTGKVEYAMLSHSRARSRRYGGYGYGQMGSTDHYSNDDVVVTKKTGLLAEGKMLGASFELELSGTLHEIIEANDPPATNTLCGGISEMPKSEAKGFRRYLRKQLQSS